MIQKTKIKLPKGQRIKFGSKITATEIFGYIHVQYETEEDYKPKKGDFIFVQNDDGQYIGIYDHTDSPEYEEVFTESVVTLALCKIGDDEYLTVYKSGIEADYIRRANDEEQEILLAKMEEVNKKFNAENCSVEDITRKRLPNGTPYCYLEFDGLAPVIKWTKEDNTRNDSIRFREGNYFLNAVEASKTADRIKKELKQNRRR